MNDLMSEFTWRRSCCLRGSNCWWSSRKNRSASGVRILSYPGSVGAVIYWQISINLFNILFESGKIEAAYCDNFILFWWRCGGVKLRLLCAVSQCRRWRLATSCCLRHVVKVPCSDLTLNHYIRNLGSCVLHLMRKLCTWCLTAV